MSTNVHSRVFARDPLDPLDPLELLADKLRSKACGTSSLARQGDLLAALPLKAANTRANGLFADTLTVNRD